MQLDKLVIPTNPKTSWQCFDLGARVAITHFKTLFITFIMLSLPFFVVGVMLGPVYVFLTFWLLKPWFERALLYILSRAVFDTDVSIKEAIKAWPSQIKPLWFSSITFRRLAPSRSFDMAVTQLEKLTGSRRSNRLSVLHRSHDDNTFWLTALCAHWEMFIVFGLFALAQILLPAEFENLDLYTLYLNENKQVVMLSMFLVYVAAALVAPFYVAGGFVSYLNRRVILEAWDIELSFKKWRTNFLVQNPSYVQEQTIENLSNEASSINENSSEQNIERPLENESASDIVQNDALEQNDDEPQVANQESESVNNNSSKNIKSHILGACLLVLGANFFIADTAYSQVAENIDSQTETSNEAIDSDNDEALLALQSENVKAIRADLDDIYNNEPFGGKKTVTRYRYRFSDDDEEEEQDVDFDGSWLSVFATIGKFIAGSLQVILWGVFIGLFVYILYRNWSTLSGFFTVGESKVDEIPLPTFISKSFTEKLPNDVVLAVNEAISKQDFRRALSLLVRASLTILSEKQEIRITKSMTENECLTAIKRVCSGSIHGFMQTLMQQWMKMAWAHQLPSNDELVYLVQAYESDFLNELNYQTNTNSQSSEEGGKQS